MMNPRTDNRVPNCGASTNKLTMPKMAEVITDAACSSAWVLQIPRHIRRTGRYGTTPGDCDIDVRSPWSKYPVMIGGIGVLPTRGHSGAFRFSINYNTLFLKKSGIPKSWTLLLIKIGQ